MCKLSVMFTTRIGCKKNSNFLNVIKLMHFTITLNEVVIFLPPKPSNKQNI